MASRVTQFKIATHSFHQIIPHLHAYCIFLCGLYHHLMCYLYFLNLFCLLFVFAIGIVGPGGQKLSSVAISQCLKQDLAHSRLSVNCCYKAMADIVRLEVNQCIKISILEVCNRE